MPCPCEPFVGATQRTPVATRAYTSPPFGWASKSGMGMIEPFGCMKEAFNYSPLASLTPVVVFILLLVLLFLVKRYR